MREGVGGRSRLGRITGFIRDPVRAMPVSQKICPPFLRAFAQLRQRGLIGVITAGPEQVEGAMHNGPVFLPLMGVVLGVRTRGADGLSDVPGFVDRVEMDHRRLRGVFSRLKGFFEPPTMGSGLRQAQPSLPPKDACRSGRSRKFCFGSKRSASRRGKVVHATFSGKGAI
jgi:hypothetical protein